jgi:hypothetical protein
VLSLINLLGRTLAPRSIGQQFDAPDAQPLCIAGGTAHEKFDAEFVYVAGVGGYGD